MNMKTKIFIHDSYFRLFISNYFKVYSLNNNFDNDSLRFVQIFVTITNASFYRFIYHVEMKMPRLNKCFNLITYIRHRNVSFTNTHLFIFP